MKTLRRCCDTYIHKYCMSAHRDDLFLVVCFVLLLSLLLCAFYVRVDTVISRNGMNKVTCMKQAT